MNLEVLGMKMLRGFILLKLCSSSGISEYNNEVLGS